MKYATAAALRAALDQRLVTEANTSGTDLTRLRRRVTFERLLVRFALADSERWVLKGGAAVEVRMADRARTTKDIDLAARHTEATDADVREALVDVLLSDPQGDFFEFRLDKFRAIGIHGVMGPVWRARSTAVSTAGPRPRRDRRGRADFRGPTNGIYRPSRNPLLRQPPDGRNRGRRSVPAFRREAPCTGP